MVFNDLDAIYCAKLFTILHQLDVPNFWTVLTFDKVCT